MVAIRDDERERSPERDAVAQAGEHLDLVLLELLARAPAVALAPAPEVRGNRVSLHSKPGRQPGDDGDERRSVRLACGRELEHHGSNPTAARIASSGAGCPVQSSKDAAPCATSTSRPGTTRAPVRRAAVAVEVSG